MKGVVNESIALPYQKIQISDYAVEDVQDNRIQFTKKYRKVNGLEWSANGQWLNIATDGNIQIYPYIKQSQSLEDMCIESIYEQYQSIVDPSLKIYDNNKMVDRVAEWGSRLSWYPHWL